jgi:hypothetical protein
MTKPLELTIYPPVPPNPRPAEPLTRMNPKFRACMEWDDARTKEQRLSWQKRLTDSELAAEYHRAGSGWDETNYDRESKPEMEPISSILHRFASLPHYDRTRS